MSRFSPSESNLLGGRRAEKSALFGGNIRAVGRSGMRWSSFPAIEPVHAELTHVSADVANNNKVD